jgi:hypothetical protein
MCMYSNEMYACHYVWQERERERERGGERYVYIYIYIYSDCIFKNSMPSGNY